MSGLMGLRLARGTAIAFVLLCTAAGPAWASFPGRNGAIAYGVSSGDRSSVPATSIRAVDPRTGRVRVLRDCPIRADRPSPDCSVAGPHYSPNGLRIAFPTVELAYPVDQPEQSRPGLGIMAADGTRFENHPTPNRYSRLAWSPQGNRFLLERSLTPEDRPAAMFIASLAGNELSQVTPGAAQGRASPQPDWSSTGRIAFVASPTGCAFRCREDIFVKRVGGTARRLTYRGGSSPSWSPHATKLAFVRRVGALRGDIYIVEKNGRGLRRLTYRGGYSPTWSPDGKWIAFMRGGDLHVVRTNGERRRRLVKDVGDDFGLGLAEAVDWQALQRR